MDEMAFINFIKDNISEYEIEQMYRLYVKQEDLFYDKIREMYQSGMIDEYSASLILTNCEYYKFLLFNYMFGNCKQRA